MSVMKEASNIRNEMENMDLFKVELHNHLDGSVNPRVIYDAAKRKGQVPENVHSFQEFLPLVTAPPQSEDLLSFLKVMFYYLPILAGDRIAIKEMAVEFCRRQYQGNVLYTETRFAPNDFIGAKDSEFQLTEDEVVETVLEGLQQGTKQYGIQIRLILCLLCSWDGDEDPRSIKTLELMEKYRFDAETNPCGVVAIDIAGNEQRRVSDDIIFDRTFERAKEMGFHRTVHAGEATGASTVKQAISNLGAERIGHGYNSVQSEEVMAMLREKSMYIPSTSDQMEDLSMIHLECCPTSSVCTNAVKRYNRTHSKWTHHPMRDFVKYGMHFSLATDDPMVFQTDLDAETVICHHKMDMSWEQIAECFIRGAQAAFIDDPQEKQALIDTVTRRAEYWVKRQKRISAAKSQKELARKGMLKSMIIAGWITLSGCIVYSNKK